MDKVTKKLIQARVSMLDKQPFLGSLSMRLNVVLDKNILAACCNGITIKFNPEFVEKISLEELKFLYAHEILHVAFEHSLRLQGRNQKGFNIAGDYAINQVLVSYNMDMPKEGLLDEKYDDMNAEQIYNILQKEKEERENKDGQDGEGKNEEGDYGLSRKQEEVLENGKFESPTTGDGNDKPLNQDDIKKLKEQIKEAVMEAVNLERNQGSVSEGTKRFIHETETRFNWEDVARNYLQNIMKENFSWRKPNRKWLSHGFYLPRVESEGINKLGIGIDTSGSMTQEDLSNIASKLNLLRNQLKVNNLVVVYCDTKINKVDEYSMYDEVKLEMIGGGGTDFRPVFEHFNEDSPDLLIFFTDLQGTFPKNIPDYPVVWASVYKNDKIPFGELVNI